MALALIFSGQGAQQVGMGQSLYEQSPAAREVFDSANRVLGWDLPRVCFGGPEAELTQTRVCQPALLVHGLALAAALREQNRLPAVSFAFGLSLGEITACTFAGVFDFATGLRIVAERGRLMQEACERSRGAMAAIMGQERAVVVELCREFGVEAANFNAPGQIIISGEHDKIAAAMTAARERGMRKVVPLKVAGAYHSRLMEPARAAFADFLSEIEFRPPQCTVLTNTTGRPMAEPVEIRAALIKQIVSPVLWEDCMRQAAGLGVTDFWELGPGGVLAGLARRTDPAWRVQGYAEFADLTR